jgi:anaerobic selenocysteine-containing dehydrogenase
MAQQRASVCTLDCPDTCSLSVLVEDGQLTQVRGSTANPLTGGTICAKVTRYPEFVHGPDRIPTPLRRTGAKGEGKFERISWDAALDIIHERFSAIMAQHGPQAIMPLNYAGPHGMLAGGSMDMRFWYRLGATQLHRRALCGGIKNEAHAATYGHVPTMRPEHVAHAKLIIPWGNNVTVSQLHLMPAINAAKRAGAKVAVVDPMRTVVARQADLHLAIRPGTDIVLAWALAAELERTGGLDQAFIAAHVEGAADFMAQAREWPVERAAAECGVPAAQIRQLAEWYRDAEPAVICPGNGLERNRNGGSGCRGLYALPALAGKFGVLGGGVLSGAGHSFPKQVAALQRPDFLPEGTRTLNIVDVGRHLLDETLDPPIGGLFVYNHNPLIVHPDQNTLRRGLSREDLFTVVSDVVMTDTVAYGDVILPACSHFEHDDLYAAYGTHFLQRAEPVIPPVGEALPNTEIFRRLAARFGFAEPAFRDSDQALMDAAVQADDPRMGGHTGSQVPLNDALSMTIDGEEAILFKNVFPATPSGKVELTSEHLGQKYGQRLPSYVPQARDFPFVLVTPSSNDRTTSTFGGLRYSDKTWLEMHPDDAAAKGLRDGATVRLWNTLGEVRMPLRITDEVAPGMLRSYKGAWMRTSDNGQTVSALAPATHADLCEGACYNDTRVDVAAA